MTAVDEVPGRLMSVVEYVLGGEFAGNDPATRLQVATEVLVGWLSIGRDVYPADVKMTRRQYEQVSDWLMDMAEQHGLSDVETVNLMVTWVDMGPKMAEEE